MKTIDGVGLMLFDQDGRILMLSMSEGKTDYSQIAGMLSVPIETIAAGESYDRALVRLIVEKVGRGKVIVPPTFYREFTIKLSRTITERLSLYTGYCEISFDARPTSKNVQFYGWLPPRTIVNLPDRRKRPGIGPIISSYLAC